MLLQRKTFFQQSLTKQLHRLRRISFIRIMSNNVISKIQDKLISVSSVNVGSGNTNDLSQTSQMESIKFFGHSFGQVDGFKSIQ